MANDIESEISQDADSTQLTVWWRGQDDSNGYIVVMGDNCTTQGQCLIAKNTVS